MINIKHCMNCHDNFYNNQNAKEGGCWCRKSGKMVWRIPVGMWERPPYLNKKARLIPDCWHGEGNNRTIYVKKEAIASDGYWKR